MNRVFAVTHAPFLAFAVACGSSRSRPPPPAPVEGATSAASTVPRPPPSPESARLEAPSATTSLTVPDYGDAVVVLPLGATKPLPVVVVMHGIADRPEWECAVWGPTVASRAFVLCPRGIPGPNATSSDPMLTFRDRDAFANEVFVALGALRAKYTRWVDPGPALFVGFSLGANYGVTLVTTSPERFPNVLLIEGGHDAWTPDRASAFARGGKRVLFLCGGVGCANDAKRAASRLSKANVEVHVRTVPGVGHAYGGKLFERAHDDIERFLTSDARIAGAAGAR